MNLRTRFRGALLGLACGDAVGAAVEFKPRGSFTPLTDMIGGGPFNLKPGEWTDDTTMALCLATSLVEKNGFDARDQMDRYVAWMTLGYLSSTGECFDIGNTTAAALRRYQVYGNPYSGSQEPRTAGNGSLMRLAPVPMFYFPDPVTAIYYAGESSRTTHGALECIDACRLFAAILIKALAGQPKESVLFGSHFPPGVDTTLAPTIQLIADGAYREKSEADISGSGYVVHCLEAALWCFWQTGNYRDAVLRAANLGDDADTTAAVCGQLAGAFYGEEDIPDSWRTQLAKIDEIIRLADRLRQ
ncbi:MAG: ADP-ribosylglycohydrolase [Chloroflexi bacterium]|nr:MAG: ADP-ribosylglycohydrolase [Chloroflexota bacterium]